MGNSRHFFATRNDLAPGLRAAEAELDVRYAECGLFDSPAVEVHASWLALADVGVARSGKTRAVSYLVWPADCELDVSKVPQRRGGAKYAVDQLANPHSIVFHPGGLYEHDCLVAGAIDTVSDTRKAENLFRRYSKLVTKGFKKVKSYYVGPEAMRMLESGKRLVTMGVDEPREYDLAV